MKKYILSFILAQIIAPCGAFGMEKGDLIPVSTTAGATTVITQLLPKEFEALEARFHQGERQETLESFMQCFQRGNAYTLPYLSEML